jgi:hypothetical protein
MARVIRHSRIRSLRHNQLVGGNISAYPEARATQPCLEDGYVWLMKNAGQTVDTQ